ncbi:protein ALP1-like [Myzus persicae]|uniref:protein ALP1-like n=1 Tax=Myzus persicae TaxID=13164 RepID=UPI000B9312F9|nr:protein ALP1-like [Myzus persicae]
MHDECIPTPNEEKWLNIAEGYQQRAQFPHCIAVVDSNYCFTFIDVGSFGKDSDSTIFKNSTLHKHLQNNSLNVPKPNLIHGIQIPMLYAFVGDEAFGLSTNMLRPYAGKCLPVNKRIFNYRLSRARRHVECAFGILSNKWRIFHRPIDVDVELVIDIVKCCCVLHNFVRARDGYDFEDSLTVTGMEDIELDNNFNVNRSVNRYRDALANYFSSELGQVAWQNEKI